MPMRFTVTGIASMLTVGALLLAGCSGGDDTAPAPPATSSPPASTPTPNLEPTAAPSPKPVVWPFTGRPLADGKRLPQRRPIAVKIENTANSEPQIGLGRADLVVQELVEGGLTRLVAFYYSKIPPDAGPVRSARTSDVSIVKPSQAVLIASGAAPPTSKRLNEAGVRWFSEGRAVGYHRVGDRYAPYNLFMHLAAFTKTQEKHRPPPAYLPWAPPGEPAAESLPSGKPARSIDARFSGSITNHWTYTGNRYRRSVDHTNGRDDFRVDSVLVLRVRITDAGYPDPAGNFVPETILTGKGAATLFHRGRAYDATWVKPKPGSALRLRTKAGQPLAVPPGHVWIELVPTGSGGNLHYSPRQ